MYKYSTRRERNESRIIHKETIALVMNVQNYKKKKYNYFSPT